MRTEKRPYSERLALGKSYEQFVYDVLWSLGWATLPYHDPKLQSMSGENKAGWEIKLDRHFRNTGNFFIETHERHSEMHQHWRPAGVCEGTANHIIIGDRRGFYILSVPVLLLEKRGKRITENSAKQHAAFCCL